ncbi:MULTISPECIES: hypothetical protein [unclassified Clostridium]|uniref:hypothetical protein n=1 Tax=unclassified Clostridium TaxID=2614128 RepID=UPI0013F8B5CE|nr:MULTISPECIES: hypothetical protein [unclassified Clostridium]NFR85394.1 hypothetical protein [Clostridium botulinum]NFR90929.1 hypothetical protein [Clostridium botulinum]NFT98792.1 hypothetical protein [Clostridium botulinum]
MVISIEILKFNLQEREYPYFEDSELQLLLDTHDGDVMRASYKGCLLKAAADDAMTVSGIKLESNRSYWLTLAETFKNEIKVNKPAYVVSRRRVDGC